MPRYFFDLRENDELLIDHEGRDLPDPKAAQLEAAASLFALAKFGNLPQNYHRLAIEVRTNDGLLFQTAFLFEMKRN